MFPVTYPVLSTRLIPVVLLVPAMFPLRMFIAVRITLRVVRVTSTTVVIQVTRIAVFRTSRVEIVRKMFLTAVVFKITAHKMYGADNVFRTIVRKMCGADNVFRTIVRKM